MTRVYTFGGKFGTTYIPVATFLCPSAAVDFVLHPEKFGAAPGNYYMG